MGAARLSGLQRRVLQLYRDALRTARSRGHLSLESRASLVATIRAETRSKATSVERLDHQRVEYLLRVGQKRLEALTATDSGVTGAVGGGDFSPSVWAIVGGAHRR